MEKIFNDNDVDMILEGMYKVLEEVGFYCESEEILKAYEMVGARVDFGQSVAKFPRSIIRNFIESVSKEDKTTWDSWVKGIERMVIYSGYLPYDDNFGIKQPPIPFMTHNLSTYYYDDEKKERRLGNKKDFIELIKLGDGLHPENGMGHALNLVKDVQAKIEPLEAALILLEYSHNPSGVYIHEVEQIKYIQEMEDIFGITDPYFHYLANIPCSSPLKLEKAVADRYVYMLKTGIYPAKLTAMPVSGVNIPITAAGSIIIVAAEFIVLWLAARIIQPHKIPLCGMPLSGTMDIRSGDISFTSFDTMIVRLGICDFIRNITGIRVAPGPGEWPPTKLPGLYCTLEKAYAAMIATAYTGYHPDIGVGHIDSGLTISPVQLLLDIEFSKGLKFLEKPVVSKDTLGIEAILEIGFGKKKNFMSHDHTIKNMKESSWTPKYFTREGWSIEIEEKIIKNALERVKEIKATYKKPEGREDKVEKVRKVIEKAKKEFLIG
jgi:trimethylamine:corrinoid methyltransferase-like protein